MKQPFELIIGKDRVLRGDFFPATEDSLGTLLICHGFKGFKDWGMFPYAAESLAQFVDVVTFNFSHNGVGEDLVGFSELEKFARNTYSRELEDLDELIHYLRGKEDFNKVKPLFLLGHSRGAGACLIYALDHPNVADGVISWNGIAAVDIFSEENKKEMREFGRTYSRNARTGQDMPLDVEILHDMEQNRDRFDIKARVKEAKVPIILIQGEEDFERLRYGSAELVNAQPAISWIMVPEGNHTFGTVHPFQGKTEPLLAAIESTKQFMKQVLSRHP